MTDNASPTQRPAKGDERNVVAVDPTAPEATLEERLALIWAQNRTLILAGIVAVFLAIIGRGLWESYAAGKARDVQIAFGAAETVEAKLAFARAHPDSPLAGIALIGAADDAYENADYATAATRYAEAAAALQDSLILGRARLGEAVSSLQAGMATKGESQLREIASDPAASEGIRAEAWYHLAAYALDSGNSAGAREAANKVGEVSPTSMWAMRAAGLLAKLPPDAPSS
jgi:predicted negative regulator of RcsB-dependent stress response